jgi:hypothetical protein
MERAAYPSSSPRAISTVRVAFRMNYARCADVEGLGIQGLRARIGPTGDNPPVIALAAPYPSIQGTLEKSTIIRPGRA